MTTPFNEDDMSGSETDFIEPAPFEPIGAGATASSGSLTAGSSGSLTAGHLGASGVLGGVAGSIAATLQNPPAQAGMSAHTALSQMDALGEKSSVITARGTAEGLVLRIDGRVQQDDLLLAAKEFLVSRRSFLSGHDVAFEWIGKKPEEALVLKLTSILLNEFAITVRSSKLRSIPKPSESKPSELSASNPSKSTGGFAPEGLERRQGLTPTVSLHPEGEKPLSLFDGVEGFDTRGGVASNSMSWDEPDARVIYGTLRSGQKIETEHSVIVFGDINSGAEVIAGGDIVILGTLRGIAHAGAYDESGGGRVIFALNLQPTQLRIGLVISRGSSGEPRGFGADKADFGKGGTPEIARVDGTSIVVETYQSRTVWGRRRE